MAVVVMVGLVHVWSLSELIPWKFTSSIWPKVILLFALGLAGWWLLLRSGPGFGVILLLGLSVLVAAGISIHCASFSLAASC